jgi:hypothetical protein
MFVVFDVADDGQTADVSEMSFTLVSAFVNTKTVTEKLQIHVFFPVKIF